MDTLSVVKELLKETSVENEFDKYWNLSNLQSGGIKQHIESVHVQLLHNYNFESMPDGFRFYERRNCIEHMMSRKNYENENGFNIERANAIKALNQWVDALPVNPHLPKRVTAVPKGTK